MLLGFSLCLLFCLTFCLIFVEKGRTSYPMSFSWQTISRVFWEGGIPRGQWSMPLLPSCSCHIQSCWQYLTVYWLLPELSNDKGERSPSSFIVFWCFYWAFQQTSACNICAATVCQCYFSSCWSSCTVLWCFKLSTALNMTAAGR